MFFETHVRIAPQDLRGSCDRLVNLAALKDRMFLFFFFGCSILDDSISTRF